MCFETLLFVDFYSRAHKMVVQALYKINYYYYYNLSLRVFARKASRASRQYTEIHW